jgi:UDP-3-O-[3-hydroxymyristoyl] N-acetylglucosamine deacetylase / 3-hydroxyacyl-[acyl-carrier-protein] dehydratase
MSSGERPKSEPPTAAAQVLEIQQARAQGAALQRTIRRPVSFRGIGLHTGVEATATFVPAPTGHGLRFVRTDLPGSPEIPVRPENARPDTRSLRRSVLAAGGAEVHTVEHLLAAVGGMGVDNLRIELSALEAPEPPDGSCRAFAELLREAGFEEQPARREPLLLREPVSLREGGVQLLAVPHDGLRLSFTIEYDNPLVGTQYLSVDIDPETFLREIAPARTFALWEDIEPLRQAGHIKGGTLQNAVVVKGDRILNEDGLRFPNEFVRHKILDLLGDLTILGRPLQAHVIAVRSGHPANVAFVQRLDASDRGSGGLDQLLDRCHFDIDAIMRIMPHRYPMLLLDRILLLEERRRVVGLKNVTINEPFFVGHFPSHPIMPAVLILEAMAQAGGILLLKTVGNPETKLVYFMSIDKAKFRKPVLPGDQLIFDLELVRLKSRICQMNGKAYVRGALVAEAVFLSTIVDR